LSVSGEDNGFQEHLELESVERQFQAFFYPVSTNYITVHLIVSQEHLGNGIRMYHRDFIPIWFFL